MSSMWGTKVKLSIFGGSHTEAIGVVIDGLPAGEKIDMDQVMLQMARRAPGKDKASTQRKEGDVPHILSGFLNGVTTGAPLCAVIENTNTRSADYGNIALCPRPGHSDYTAWVKYQGYNDIRGGGHFSGRLTANLVFAGAVCRQILERRGIVIGAHALRIGGVQDQAFDMAAVTREQLQNLNTQYFSVLSSEAKEKMYERIEAARMEQDSVGGVIECAAMGVPAGLGDPMFGGVESVFSSILFGIPAVKGVEFGGGFESAEKTGSENNDAFCLGDDGEIRTKTNYSGGILGGITDGMPLVFRMAVKPTPSISKPQRSVNLSEKKEEELVIRGRHDPCIVPRAIPVAEAAAAVAIMNLL